MRPSFATRLRTADSRASHQRGEGRCFGACLARVSFDTLAKRTTMRSMQAGRSLLIWCSHTRMTRHPRRRSFAKFRTSRDRVRSIFCCQKGDSRCFHTGYRKPCQKSPSTKTTNFADGNTMSGLPGRVRTFFRYLKPRRVSSLRTAISRRVSKPRIRDMQ
jgi:hypothetical protein